MGELFTAIMFESPDNYFDIPDICTVFGFLLAICLQFIYFTTDKEKMRHFEHTNAIRNAIWQFLHLPFHLSVIIMGCSIYNLVARMRKYLPYENIDLSSIPVGYDPIENSLRWMFTFSVSLNFILLTFMALLKRREPFNKTLFPVSIILGFRFLTGIGILLLGLLGTRFSAFGLMGLTTILAVLNMAFSVVGLQNVGDLQDSAVHFKWGFR